MIVRPGIWTKEQLDTLKNLELHIRRLEQSIAQIVGSAPGDVAAAILAHTNSADNATDAEVTAAIAAHTASAQNVTEVELETALEEYTNFQLQQALWSVPKEPCCDDEEDEIGNMGPPGSRGFRGPVGPTGPPGLDGEEVELFNVAFQGFTPPNVHNDAQFFWNSIISGTPRTGQVNLHGFAASRINMSSSQGLGADETRWAIIAAFGAWGIQIYPDDGSSLKNAFLIARDPNSLVAITQLTFGNTTDYPHHTFHGGISGSFIGGTMSVLTNRFAMFAKRFQLTGTQRITLAGTSRLRVH